MWGVRCPPNGADGDATPRTDEAQAQMGNTYAVVHDSTIYIIF